MLLSVTQNATVGNATRCCMVATGVIRSDNAASMERVRPTGLDWDDFKYFTAVAAEGSVRGAATRLGVHASTVTRRLDQFERRLGVTLFNRSQQGLTITPEGAGVIERVDRIAEELGDIERFLVGKDQSLAGRVRITLPDVIAVSFLTLVTPQSWQEEIAHARTGRWSDLAIQKSGPFFPDEVKAKVRDTMERIEATFGDEQPAPEES